MASFQDRIIRAAKLDVHLYEEVEADKGAMGQAMGVVVLSGVAAGIGSIGTSGMAGILFGTITALVGWYIWAYITYLLEPNYYRNRRQKQTMVNYFVQSDFPALLVYFGY